MARSSRRRTESHIAAPATRAVGVGRKDGDAQPPQRLWRPGPRRLAGTMALAVALAACDGTGALSRPCRPRPKVWDASAAMGEDWFLPLASEENVRMLSDMGFFGETERQGPDEATMARARRHLRWASRMSYVHEAPHFHARLPGLGTPPEIVLLEESLSGVEVEFKMVPMLNGHQRRNAMKELEVLENAGGGDVVSLFGSSTVGGMAMMITETSSRTLFDLLYGSEEVVIPGDLKLRFLVEILRGVSQVNGAGFIHGDIKPESIVLVGDHCSAEGCHAKVAEFGMARRLSSRRRAKARAKARAEAEVRAKAAADAKEEVDEVAEADEVAEVEVADEASDDRLLRGSPIYMAPEVWRRRRYLRKADVWSVGMLAYEMFVGGFPVDLERAGDTSCTDLKFHPYRTYVPDKFKIAEDAKLQAFASLEPEIASLIRRMLAKRRWKRPSAASALNKALKIATSRGIEVPEQPPVYVDRADLGLDSSSPRGGFSLQFRAAVRRRGPSAATEADALAQAP
eukprot:CAMPEP_0176029214 /NCGR_PEP_ID=MMETSP0120_2-20121206/14352_1 /TAXON_ID=160619 /ORGANISM="Kryptoperidinium foliaceum, Strain CCMP 1326" /LENGTH=513 /DNA_ID=CAMNT_0017362437 /DNA_START=88 /DNA_END=1630 /DNA_ORIENTATION=+